MTPFRLTLPACAAVLAVAFAAPGAQAARGIQLHARTAGELAHLCVANPSGGVGDAEINFCDGYGQGLADAVRHFEPKAVCFPKPAPTRHATMEQFAHWVAADPTHAQLPASAGLYNFLRERYPCGK